MGDGSAAGAAGLTVKVGIGVGKRNAKIALRHAIDNHIIPPNAVVCLLYVQTPIRRVPNDLGGEYIVENVDPERVQAYKKELFLQAQKLINEYQVICDSKRVKSEGHYNESETVGKGLLEQAYEHGISLLILGRSGSARNAIFRALTSDIATSMAKFAPNFCTVMTISSNGKVSVHKNGTESTSTSQRSQTSGLRTPSSSSSFDLRSDDWMIDGTSVSAKTSTASAKDVEFSRGSRDQISDIASVTGLKENFPPKIVQTQNGYTNTVRTSFKPPMPDFGNQAIRATPDTKEVDNTPSCPSMEDVDDLADDLISIHASSPSIFGETKLREIDESWNEALKDAKNAMQKALTASDRCHELSFSLQEALKDQELLREQLNGEVQRHKETQAKLEKFKEMIHMLATEANSAKVEVQEERRRYEQASEKLGEVNKKLGELTEMLDVEHKLRKDAEDRAYHESVAKQEAFAALQRATRKYTVYSFEELQLATRNFHEENKVGEGGCGAVYQGQLHGMTVAIEVLMIEEYSEKGSEELLRKLTDLSSIRHQHIVMLLGVCTEKHCIVYEYIENGCLEDHLNCKNGMPSLPWYVRFKICLEIATALHFLHSQPKPIIHRNLNLANIFLDHNLVCKIGDVGLAVLVPNSMTMYKDSKLAKNLAYIDPEIQRAGRIDQACDIYSLGIVMLQLLTGRQAIGVADLVEDALDSGNLEDILDKSAGDWPIIETLEIAQLSLLCAEPRRKNRPGLETKILPELERIQRSASETQASIPNPIAPSFALCPISQEIMQDPHMAADGFTYEHEPIKAWLQEHSTSPMTNLPLDHKNLIPNHCLRSAIKEWFKN